LKVYLTFFTKGNTLKLSNQLSREAHRKGLNLFKNNFLSVLDAVRPKGRVERLTNTQEFSFVWGMPWKD
jgi:hypothetical protein